MIDSVMMDKENLARLKIHFNTAMEFAQSGKGSVFLVIAPDDKETIGVHFFSGKEACPHCLTESIHGILMQIAENLPAGNHDEDTDSEETVH